MAASCDFTVYPLDGEPAERLAVLVDLAEAGTLDPDVQRVTRELLRGVVGERARAKVLLAYVQGLAYRVDRRGRDDGANACAVLLKGVGDCKKKGLLLASMFALAGLRSVLVWKLQEATLDHVTVEVWVDGDWRWAEPTIVGARLGENPYAAARRVDGLRDGWL